MVASTGKAKPNAKIARSPEKADTTDAQPAKKTTQLIYIKHETQKANYYIRSDLGLSRDKIN